MSRLTSSINKTIMVMLTVMSLLVSSVTVAIANQDEEDGETNTVEAYPDTGFTLVDDKVDTCEKTYSSYREQGACLQEEAVDKDVDECNVQQRIDTYTLLFGLNYTIDTLPGKCAQHIRELMKAAKWKMDRRDASDLSLSYEFLCVKQALTETASSSPGYTWYGYADGRRVRIERPVARSSRGIVSLTLTQKSFQGLLVPRFRHCAIATVTEQTLITFYNEGLLVRRDVVVPRSGGATYLEYTLAP